MKTHDETIVKRKLHDIPSFGFNFIIAKTQKGSTHFVLPFYFITIFIFLSSFLHTTKKILHQDSYIKLSINLVFPIYTAIANNTSPFISDTGCIEAASTACT